MAKMEEIVKEEKLTLAEKIVNIMSEVQRLQKDDNVEFGKTKYKALSEEKVTTIMREKLVKYNILVYPIEQEWSREGSITHVNVKYRMVNAENPSDYIEIVSCGDGADSQDKGSGKAQTYAYKYMWLRTFALPTGEDPDKISSDELDAKEAEQKALEETITNKEVMILENMLSDEQKAWTFKAYQVDSLSAMSKAQYGDLMKRLNAQQQKKGEQA